MYIAHIIRGRWCASKGFPRCAWAFARRLSFEWASGTREWAIETASAAWGIFRGRPSPCTVFYYTLI